MKSIKSILLSAGLLSILLTACQDTPQHIQIQGTITNSEAEKAKLYNDNVDLEIDINEGSFLTSFEATEPMYLNIRIGREMTTMFVTPGQKLDIQLDAEIFDESLVYSGEGSEASNYLAKKILNEENIVGEALYKLEEDAFLEQLKQNELNGLALLDTPGSGLSPEFLEMEKVNLKYGQNIFLINYEPAHRHYAKKENFKATPEFHSMLAGIDINNENFLGIDNYGSFITSSISNKAYAMSLDEEKYVKEPDAIMKATIDLVTEKIENAKVRSYAIDQLIKQNLSYSSALGLVDYMADIRKLTQNEKTFKLIDESLDKWGHLAKGEPAPDFDGTTVKGIPVKLSDFQGKNVYIDVWATWCGPCLREQPSLFELEAKYKGNDNLAFMGVSIDSDKPAWEKMVTEKDMMGEQIFTEGAWKSTICDKYLINGIPRFILIDKHGKIIDSDAPRPSSEAIKGILKELSGVPLLSSL